MAESQSSPEQSTTVMQHTSSSNDRQEIREFSKLTPEGRQTRSETALAVLSARRDTRAADARIAELKSIINSISADSEQRRERIASLQAELDTEREDLAQTEASLVSKIYHLLGQKSQAVDVREHQVKVTEGFTQYHHEEIARNDKQLRESGETLKRFQERKVGLRSAKSLLDDFYTEQAGRFEEYRKDQERRKMISQITDIANVADEYGVYFIHGILPAFAEDVMGGEAMSQRNPLLKWNAGWRQRTAIVVGLQPDISVSAIKPGDTPVNMWSRMGVIINGGNLVNAHPRDASTVVKGIQEQQSAHHDKTFYEMQPEEVGENIRAAIEGRGPKDYNEFVVRDPEIAGFYLCLDADDPERIVYRTPINKYIEGIIGYLTENNIPLYIVHNGAVYEGEPILDSSGKIIIQRVGEPLSPSDIIRRKITIDYSHQETMKQEGLASLNLS
ncbi:hypothetical protein HYW41_04265 [Candidatus Daviesbacteria bacterium]|nr:hypothetical protein [Candidatus Daviesbacteria bacterium]